MVQRYEMRPDANDEWIMTEEAGGQYVHYQDYAALEAEAEKLRAFVKAWDSYAEHACVHTNWPEHRAMMAAREAVDK